MKIIWGKQVPSRKKWLLHPCIVSYVLLFCCPSPLQRKVFRCLNGELSLLDNISIVLCVRPVFKTLDGVLHYPKFLMLCLHELQESDFTINISQYSNMDAILKQGKTWFSNFRRCSDVRNMLMVTIFEKKGDFTFIFYEFEVFVQFPLIDLLEYNTFAYIQLLASVLCVFSNK